jgi:hypothetical protein
LTLFKLKHLEVVRTYFKLKTFKTAVIKDLLIWTRTTHPNELASTLLEEEEVRRMKTFKPTDLTTRFS